METSINQGITTTSVQPTPNLPDAGAVVNKDQLSSVKVTFEKIIVDNVRENRTKLDAEGNPTRATAELRQTTYRHYPSGKVGNDLQDTIFATEDFGFTDRIVPSDRMAFIDVPLKVKDANGNMVNITKEYVQAMIDRMYAQAKGDRMLEPIIYEILQDEAILSDTQKQAIKAGLVNIDDIAYGRPVEDPESEFYGQRIGGQLVRYGKRADESLGQHPTDMVPSPAGLEQFRQTFFSKTYRPDKDTRTQAPSLNTQRFTREELSERANNIISGDKSNFVENRNRPNPFAGTLTRGEVARRGGLPGVPTADQASDIDNADPNVDGNTDIIS